MDKFWLQCFQSQQKVTFISCHNSEISHIWTDRSGPTAGWRKPFTDWWTSDFIKLLHLNQNYFQSLNIFSTSCFFFTTSWIHASDMTLRFVLSCILSVARSLQICGVVSFNLIWLNTLCLNLFTVIVSPVGSREDFQRIPELAINPLGDRIINAFFPEGWAVPVLCVLFLETLLSAREYITCLSHIHHQSFPSWLFHRKEASTVLPILCLKKFNWAFYQVLYFKFVWSSISLNINQIFPDISLNPQQKDVQHWILDPLCQ